jgi:hypothetical protein
MTSHKEFFESNDVSNSGPERIAYIKPTKLAEAKRLGIVPAGIKLPANVTLYVVHAVDGTVLGFTDAWDSAYGAAIQNELTPVSLH